MRAPLLALSVTTLCLCAPAGAQTVLNGSFEEPVITSGYFQNIGMPGFTGWSILSGDVDVVRLSDGQGWAAQDGAQSLDRIADRIHVDLDAAQRPARDGDAIGGMFHQTAHTL